MKIDCMKNIKKYYLLLLFYSFNLSVYGDVVNSIDWNPQKLRYVQNFLDEVNEAIWPIKDECDCYCIGDWHITDGPKATATWDWTDNGFKVMGTEL